MKRIKITSKKAFAIVCIFATGLFSHGVVASDFYYSCGKKQEIRVVENKIMVKKKPDKKTADCESLVRNSLGDIQTLWQGDEFCKIEMKQTDVDRRGFRSLLSHEDIESVSPVYALEDGFEIGFSNEIIVKFWDKVDERQKAEILKTFDLQQTQDAMPVFEMYALPKDADVITTANRLYETGLCKFAYPRVICESVLFEHIPNDPYFRYQVALHNTGQAFTDGHTGTPDADIDAPEAWEITTGSSNIIVAVIDEGVTSNHPDLPNTRQVRLPGSNFSGIGNPDNPAPIGEHGDACAGIIAATMDNNEGIAGIAPGCKIMPIVVKQRSTEDIRANAIRFAVNNGAKIISNSWGYDTPSSFGDALPEAIRYAVSHGVVVLFAASNSAHHFSGEDGLVAFPANQNIAGMIAVGASDRYDRQSDYSPTGSRIDIVAPSHKAYTSEDFLDEAGEMWTLDNPGAAGYNPYKREPHDTLSYPANGEELPNSGPNHLAYTGRFGGTSFSCPVVAGVVALMLSVNPDLTPVEVTDILYEMADKIGDYNYGSNEKSLETGYGRVNANKAVRRLIGDNFFTYKSLDSAAHGARACKELYVKYVTVQGQAQVSVDAGRRVIIRPPFRAAPQGEGFFWAKTDPCNSSVYPSPALRSSPATGDTDDSPVSVLNMESRRVFLSQNTPNPVKERAVIRYFVPESGRPVSLRVTTLMGALVKNIPLSATGENEVVINVSGWQAGVYLYSLVVGGKIAATRRIIVVR